VLAAVWRVGALDGPPRIPRDPPAPERERDLEHQLEDFETEGGEAED
jgi:hypothetical protein